MKEMGRVLEKYHTFIVPEIGPASNSEKLIVWKKYD